MPNIRKVKIYTTDYKIDQLTNSLPDIPGWLNRKIYELCNEKITPILPLIESATKKQQLHIVINQLEISDKSNLELLEKFAAFEHTSVANIIYNYIIFPEIEKVYLKGKCCIAV